MIKKFTLNKNIFFILIPLIFTLIYYRFEVIYGFNPTDEGRNFALINRVLNFDIPHKDFTFTHFIGSTLLHFYQEFIPSHNIQISRMQNMLFMFFYSYVFLDKIEAFKNSNFLYKIILFFATSLINFHIFPMFSWPTVDGIFLFSLFLFLEDKLSKSKQKFGYLILGFLPLIKFGFVLLIPTIFIRNIYFKKNINVSEQVKYLKYSCIPLFVYTMIISLFGGFKDLVSVTTDTVFQLDLYLNGLGLNSITWIYYTVIAFTFLQISLKKKSRFAANICIFIYLYILETRYFNVLLDKNISEMTPIGISQMYEFNKPNIFLLGLFFFVFNLFNKKFKNFKNEFEILFLLLAVEASSILSFGWKLSQWVYGSILMTLLIIINRSKLQDSDKSVIDTKKSSVILILSIFSIILLNTFQQRNDYNYRDLGNSELQYNLIEVDKSFGNIKTNKNTFSYLNNLKTCSTQIDSSRIHFFPDNPIMYFILDIQNPLPISWHEAISEEVKLDNLKTEEKISLLTKDDFPFYIILQDNFAALLINESYDEVVTFSNFDSFSNSDKLEIIKLYKTKLKHNTYLCGGFEIMIVEGLNNK